MDAWEATKVLMWKLQRFDPENASRIMARILLHNLSGEEMVRLGFAPDFHLLSCINQIKISMGILPSSNILSAPATPAANSSNIETWLNLFYPATVPDCSVNGSGEGLASDDSLNLPDDLYPKFLHPQPLQGTTQPFVGFSHSGDLRQPSFNSNQRIDLPLPPATRSTPMSCSYTVFVSFAYGTTVNENVIADYFRSFGPLLKVTLKVGYGFVTFMYSESASAILARGNPHWIQGSSFVVRPYESMHKLVLEMEGMRRSAEAPSERSLRIDSGCSENEEQKLGSGLSNTTPGDDRAEFWEGQNGG